VTECTATPARGTATIHRLLRHLHANGVEWVPQPIGLDDDGREIVTFLPGTVPRI
jgi:hypothetical protein